MKVEFKITLAQYLALADALDYLIKTEPKTKSSKIIKSSLLDLAVQIGKKRLKLRQEINIFSDKKNLNLSLKYFEASYLESYLDVVNGYPSEFPLGDYERLAIQTVKDIINQKLA